MVGMIQLIENKPMNPRPLEDTDYLEVRDYFLGGIFLAMEVKGWDEQRLSDESGISVNTISRYRNGEIDFPHLWTLYRLSNAVGMELLISKI
jgi:ribosome-binding protein aMBF1 (putative translation factor)